MRHLVIIGALESSDKNNTKNKIIHEYLSKIGNEDRKFDDKTVITNVGRLIKHFPVAPRYGKIIIVAYKVKLLEYALLIVALMNIENIFEISYNSINDEESNSNRKNVYKSSFKLKELLNNADFLIPESDPITYINILIEMFNKTNFKNFNSKNIQDFCFNHNLNVKKVKELVDLLEQLYKISIQVFKLKENPFFETFKNLKKVSIKDSSLLSQVLLSGFIDNIARRKIIYDDVGNEKEAKVKRIIYECNENNEQTQIHHLSVLSKEKPQYIIYKEIIKETQTFLFLNTKINPEWLYNIGGDLVSYNINNSASSNINKPFYDSANDQICCFVNIKYGFKAWDIENVKAEMKNEGDILYRWFARFLLEGKILKKLDVK